MIQLCKHIATSQWFQHTIIAVIILAGAAVGVGTYASVAYEYADILRMIDIFILIIFTLEVIIKMTAEMPHPITYFKDPWNIFDFLLVAACLLEPILPIDAAYLPVLRLIRILRVLKLVTAIPRLQLLVGALLKSVPSMFYVSMLLSLLFYIYAAMGASMFGDNDPIHFGSLQIAMLSLFRIVTLEDWTDIMYINMYGSNNYGYADYPNLETIPQAMPVFAALFFVSFVIIGTMIVLNLFIGIIMNSMDETRKEGEATALAEKRQSDNLSLADEITLLHDDLSKMQTHLDLILHRVQTEPTQELPP